jgi:two-component system OmpR family sensor kinase/two-component system sensor histidine kinase BaeS
MRSRLILSFILIALLSVVSVTLFFRQSAATQVRAYMFRGGMFGQQGLVTALEEYYQENRTWQGLDSTLLAPMHAQGQASGNPNAGAGGMMGRMGQRLRLADAQGDLVVDTSDPQASGRLSASELQDAIPLESGGSVVGYLLPEGGVRFNRGDEIALVGLLNRAALKAALIVIGFAVLLALLLGYRLSQPVQALTRAAGRLAHGDLYQRVAVSGDDEIAALGKAFNHMAASLQQAEESRRAMTADIAHELRNPLAVQRAHLEALQDGVYPATPENLALVLDQNILLTRLVDDLRTLALADAGQLHLEFTPTDFAALVQRVAARFTSQADAQGVDLGFISQGVCELVSLDPIRVEQILGNLLSNALRYTPAGGRIDLELDCTIGKARLAVRDSGPGIAEEALPHVFERFYRSDRSRSRTEGGVGLGLAIARQLAEAHQGTLVAANDPMGGAVFTLVLPYTQESGPRDQE